MPRFAADTTVSVDRSIAEIRSLITKYGARSFGQLEEQGRAAIAFEMRDRRIRFVLMLPDRNDKQFTHTAAKSIRRSPDEAARAWEQGCRQRWRALVLAVKAKLEAVESGIETFDQAFMAHIVLPTGQTIGESYLKQLPQIFQSGATPPLLLEGPTQ